MDLSAVDVKKNLDASGKLKQAEKERRQRGGLCWYDRLYLSSELYPNAARLAERNRTKPGRITAINIKIFI